MSTLGCGRANRIALYAAAALLAGCGSAAADSTAARPPSSAPETAGAALVATAAQQAAARDVVLAYKTDLAALQATGASALAPGGDVAGFYRRFGETALAAAGEYAALDVPPAAQPARDKVVGLLQQQAAVLEEIATRASGGAADAAAAKLGQLTTLMNEFAAANTALMGEMGVEPEGS